jgi:hypothetical protein
MLREMVVEGPFQKRVRATERDCGRICSSGVLSFIINAAESDFHLSCSSGVLSFIINAAGADFRLSRLMKNRSTLA